MDIDVEQQSQAEALIPFTGYYTLDSALGSFVAVETRSNWQAGASAPTIEYEATIAISSDGQTSEQYSLGPNCSFEFNQLLITDPAGDTIADLSFSNEGGLGSLQGMVAGSQVTGTTPFGPVELSIWAGTYYRQGPPFMIRDVLQYPYVAALQIGTDGSVQFASGSEPLQPLPSYSYVYGMFVISFPAAPQIPTQILEMGTDSVWGRVAGDASNGSMLVALQLQQPAPQL
ncbi:MAG TPA: hypothetical protein VF759_09615 [Allosphingosinicella sp.]|jgi:hypothetical protein